MLVSFETNMIVIHQNASVRISTKLWSVNYYFFLFLTEETHSDDIDVSLTSFHKMIKTSNDSNEERGAFPTWDSYWDKHFVNGEYVIAYKFDPNLDQAVRNGLPEVCDSEIIDT